MATFRRQQYNCLRLVYQKFKTTVPKSQTLETFWILSLFLFLFFQVITVLRYPDGKKTKTKSALSLNVLGLLRQ